MTIEDEKVETCRVAMKAALEAIQDYCGTGRTGRRAFIEDGQLRLEIPDEVYDVLESYRKEKWPFSTLYSYFITEDAVTDIARQICALQGDTSLDCRDRVVRGLIHKIITNEDLKPWIGTFDPDELQELEDKWSLPNKE